MVSHRGSQLIVHILTGSFHSLIADRWQTNSTQISIYSTFQQFFEQKQTNQTATKDARTTPWSYIVAYPLAETDSADGSVDAIHYEDGDLADPLSWAAATQGPEAFVLPQPHRSFKEFVGNKTDLGRAVIPAAMLAGYTGTDTGLAL